MEVSGKFNISTEMMHQIISYVLTNRRDVDHNQQKKNKSKLADESAALLDCVLDTILGLYINWDTFKNQTDQTLDPNAIGRFILDTLPDDFKFRTLRLLSKSMLVNQSLHSNL